MAAARTTCCGAACPTNSDRGIEAAGAIALSTKDAQAFGPDVIHSVVNPIQRVTGAIHVYGGDFFAAKRSEWDPEVAAREALRHEEGSAATSRASLPSGSAPI